MGTRESRRLTRTTLAQGVHYVAASSVHLDRSYRELMDQGLHEKKLRQYERVLKRVKEERPA
ncbi:MAG: hypothetical protein ABSG21_11320 [Spirochaetia bacterium]|jgi:hypothetical protein